MRTRTLAAAVVIIIGVGSILGGGTIVASDDRPPIGEAPPLNKTTPAEMQTQTASETPQTYAVTAQSASSINTTRLAQHGEVGTQAGNRIELTMPPENMTAVNNISWVTGVDPAVRPEPSDIPGGSDGESLGVADVHAAEITGEEVTVGVIDQGFNADNPTIESNVVETASFRDGVGDPAHGTSVAEVVTRTAPDSQLYLVSIDTGVATERAIQYLNAQGVDVIVFSAGFISVPGDGSHFLTDDINAATRNGTLFVTSAGNYAQTHWEGKFRDTDNNSAHEWTASGDELNCIPDCNSEYSGSVAVYVSWNDTGAENQSAYSILLYNSQTDEIIASRNNLVFEGASGNKWTRLVTSDLPRQEVNLVIQNTVGPADDKLQVVETAAPSFQRTVPESSIVPPADVPAALTVAAYERQERQIAAYSSQGPVNGRQTVDVAGYTNINVENGLYAPPPFSFGGTSAAAPYAGGIAALVEEQYARDPSPATVTTTLQSSSDDILAPGGDPISGAGVVNAEAAVESVRTTTPTPDVSLQPSNQTVTKGKTTRYNITITNASAGVSEYDLTVTIDNTSVAAITNASAVRTGDVSSTVALENESATVQAELLNISADDTNPAVTVGTVTVRGEDAGTAELGINVSRLTDQTGQTYPSVTATGSIVTVETADESGPQNNVTVAFDPSSARAVPGGTTTVNVLITNASDIATYDISLRTNNTAVARIGEVTLQGDPDVQNVSIASDGSAATASGALADIDATEAGSIAQLRVQIPATASEPGELTVTVNALGDANGTRYELADETAAMTISPQAGPGDVTGNGNPAADPDGDGTFEDVNGDGTVDVLDVQALFSNLQTSGVKGNSAFDVNGDGTVDVLDVQALFVRS